MAATTTYSFETPAPLSAVAPAVGLDPATEENRSAPWFAVRVKSNREQVVARSLAAKGLGVCLPTYARLAAPRSGCAARRKVDAPLFPGYLFCEFDPALLLPVVMVPGVVNVLSLGNKPEPVDPSEIFALLQLMRAGVVAQPYPYLASGERIRIRKGPLTGVEGTVVREKGEARLVINVSLLFRSVAAEVDRSWVEPL